MYAPRLRLPVRTGVVRAAKSSGYFPYRALAQVMGWAEVFHRERVPFSCVLGIADSQGESHKRPRRRTKALPHHRRSPVVPKSIYRKYTYLQSASPNGLWVRIMLTLKPTDWPSSETISTGLLFPLELHCSQIGRAPSSVRCREIPLRLSKGSCCLSLSTPLEVSGGPAFVPFTQLGVSVA